MEQFVPRGKRAVKNLLGLPAVGWMVAALARGNPFFSESFRWRIANCVPIRQAVVSAVLPNGRRIHLYHDGFDDITKAVFWNGYAGYENGTPRWFFRRCQSARMVIDVGASVGYYSLLAALAAPDATLVAIEPVPEAYRRLARNISLNPVGDRIRTIAAAATNHDGDVTVYVPRTGIACESSLIKGFRKDVIELKSRATTLDTLVREMAIQAVDLVKIDAEGSEHLVLEGMTEILSAMKPDIMCEVLPGRFRTESEGLLKKHGYRFGWIKESRIVPMDRMVGDPSYRCLNYYFSTRLV